MRWMNYFGDYQPLDGRIGFIFREAFRDRDDFYYKTHFSLKGDGILFILIHYLLNTINFYYYNI